ncbi:glycosyltransferase [Desemzia incerta]|uniref:glycosyltransferase n=1 Tax=Desemzia incerta TaxID=82801 RepID=UPI00331594AA
MDSKKNVVLLIPSLKRGGAERVVSRLSKILANDFNLKVVIFDSREIDYECSCEVIDLGEASSGKSVLSKFIKSLSRIIKYYRFKKKNNVDITYSFGNSANIVNVFSGWRDKKVTSLRGYGNIKYSNNSLSSFIISKVAKITNKNADLIISVSQLIKETVNKEYSIDESKIEVIYNGYDINEIRSQAEEPISVEIKNWMKDKFVFISMGSYREEKGYQHLIRSFSEVNKNYKNTGLLIVGKGNPKIEKDIKNLIRDLGIEDKVYLAGFQKNPYSLLSNSNSYVLSSLSEGFPNALVEAMACGLPVISTDCNSGPKEILAEIKNLSHVTKQINIEEYGILVEPVNANKDNINNVERALTESMIVMLENEEIRNRIKNKVNKRAKEFSYELWRSKHVQAFDNLI